MARYDDFPPELARMMRRKHLSYCVRKWTGLTLISAIIVFAFSGTILALYGEDAWPSAAFLSLLALYCFSVYWRYTNRERTEEDYLYHPDE